MTTQTELQEYLELLRQRPPADTLDPMLETVKDPLLLERYSREHQRKLGIVYRSKLHIYVVDLVRDRTGRLFTMERLLKAVTGGCVVTVPFHGDKVILLRQYRHTMGQYQYAFPRGFAEEGLTPQENARKELQEELNCRTGQVTLLGQVVADSGICGEKVWVYRCEVEAPHVDGIYESIESYREVTLPQLLEMVRRGQINDGFTLSAIALLQSGITAE